MKWASALSEQTPLSRAIEECANSVRQQLGELTPDLAVVFASSHFQEEFEEVPSLLREKLGPSLILGCSGGGIIGNGKEVEQQPAVSITATSLPDVSLTPFHLENDNLPDLDAGRGRPQTLPESGKRQRPPPGRGSIRQAAAERCWHTLQLPWIVESAPKVRMPISCEAPPGSNRNLLIVYQTFIV